MLPEESIAASLAKGSASQITQELVELANEAGGMDNVTVQVVILPNPETETESTVTAVGSEDPGAAAAGPWLRWAIALVLLAGVLVLLLGGGAPGE